MYAFNRTRCFASVLAAMTAGLLGAALAHQEPDSCECRLDDATPVFVLPEVEMTASRLPARPQGTHD